MEVHVEPQRRVAALHDADRPGVRPRPCGEAGQLLIHLVSAFSEFERQVLIERTKAGLVAAQKRGARIGRPKVFVDKSKAKHLQEKGWSIRRIAKSMGVGIGTVQRALADA